MPENNEEITNTNLSVAEMLQRAEEEELERVLNTARQNISRLSVRTPRPIITSGDLETIASEEKLSPETTVKHYKTKEEIKSSEAVKIYNLGYVKSNEPNIIQDYYRKDLYFLNDKDVKQTYALSVIYTDIDSNGQLIKPVFSISQIDIRYNTLRFDGGSAEDPKLKIPIAEYLISDELLNNKTFCKFYEESLIDCRFYFKGTVRTSELKKHSKVMYRKLNNNDIYNQYNTVKKPNTYINTLGKKYSFGLEIETSAGILPFRFDKLIDYTAVHDGSLRDDDGHVYGGEYVTGVLRGDQGLLQTRLLTNELTKRCLLNVKCGVHVHLGDINFTKENIVLMYYLYLKLQDEILSIFPPSRRNNQYCRKLTKIKIDLSAIQSNYYFSIDHFYNEIIKVLSQRDSCSSDINKKKDHPKGHKCGYDHSAHRYCWVNFIPAVFNTRKNGIYTIEFRPHAASTSYKKIKNWLLICMALVDVVENHKNEIYNNSNITLEDVIRISYPKDHKVLNSYVEKRRIKFSTEEDHDLNETTDNEIENNLSIKNL